MPICWRVLAQVPLRTMAEMGDKARIAVETVGEVRIWLKRGGEAQAMADLVRRAWAGDAAEFDTRALHYEGTIMRAQLPWRKCIEKPWKSQPTITTIAAYTMFALMGIMPKCCCDVCVLH